MVGFEGEPGSDGIQSKAGSDINDPKSGDRDYFVGTSETTEYVTDVFEDAKYFGGQDGSYTAAGIEVDVTDEGIEYDVTQEVQDQVAQEFVDGIVRSFEDVDKDFTDDVREGISDEDREAYADGGQVIDGVAKGIPVGGAPSYVETENEEETQNMGDFPM